MSKTDDQIYLTKEGLKELEEELEGLKEKKLPKLIKRVKRARDFGDLSENAEYANAREDLAFAEGRIDELEEILAKVKIIRKVRKGKKTIGLGSKIKVKVNGKEHEFTVVGEWEANPSAKKISASSPLGKLLLGKKKGDEVEVEAPAGKLVYTILKIH